MLAVAAGKLEVLAIPRLHRFGIRETPGLGLREQLFAIRDELVDQSRGLRLLGPQLLAFEQDRHRVLHADHARDALRRAAAGKKPELHFGLAELDLRIVDRDAVVTAERELEPAAEGGAVERRDDRTAAQ